MTGETGRWRR